MLRRDLLKKLSKTPESKLSRRKTAFEQRNSDFSKSMLNVHDARHEMRSESKTPKKENLKVPEYDVTPKVSSILQRSISFNDFMETFADCEKENKFNTNVENKLTHSTKMDKSNYRINLRESAVTAQLLADVSSTLLVSSPDQTISTDDINLSRNGFESVGMLKIGNELEPNVCNIFSSPNITGTAARTPNSSASNSLEKVDNSIPSVSMLCSQSDLKLDFDTDSPSSKIVTSASSDSIEKVSDDTSSSVSTPYEPGANVTVNSQSNRSVNNIMVMTAVLNHENNKNQLDEPQNVSFSTHECKPTDSSQYLSVIDLTDSPLPNCEVELDKTFTPPKMVETILVSDETFTGDISTEKIPVSNLTFSPSPNGNKSTGECKMGSSVAAGMSGVKKIRPKKATRLPNLTPFRFGNSKGPGNFTFEMQFSSTPMPDFNRLNKENQPVPKIQPKGASVHLRSKAVNRCKLNNEQREERRIEMYENVKRITKSSSLQQNKTVIKGVRMNRRMELLFQKRDSMKNL